MKVMHWKNDRKCTPTEKMTKIDIMVGKRGFIGGEFTSQKRSKITWAALKLTKFIH